jgi:hypothetical protein
MFCPKNLFDFFDFAVDLLLNLLTLINNEQWKIGFREIF